MSWGTSAYDWFGHTGFASIVDSTGKKAQQFFGLRRDDDDQEAIELANKQAQQNLELSREEFERGHQVAALDMSRAGLNPISATAQPSTYNASGGSSTPLSPNTAIAGGIAGIISSRISANKQEKIANAQIDANAPLVDANASKAYADAVKTMTDVKNDPENQDLKRQQVTAVINELNKRAEESAVRASDLNYQLEQDKRNGTYRSDTDKTATGKIVLREGTELVKKGFKALSKFSDGKAITVPLDDIPARDRTFVKGINNVRGLREALTSSNLSQDTKDSLANFIIKGGL